MPSQLLKVDGSLQAVEPMCPHLAVLLKLYGPPPPQQAFNAPLSNPVYIYNIGVHAYELSYPN